MKVKMFDLKVKEIYLRKELNNSFNKLLSHGQFFLGPEVTAFEKKAAKFLNAKYALGVSSGSSALYLSLKACIKPGNEVITTPLTWIITINAIVACGAKPVFVDVDNDMNINADLIEEKITSKTKAIVPMHYAGHMCDMGKILKIAKKHNCVVIEDAAQAFGAKLHGKKAGTFSKVGAFSMNPMKSLSGYGENGLIVTNSKKIYSKIKMLRHAGTTSDPKKIITNYCIENSLNHKMDSLNAALLLISLKYFKKKIQIREHYSKIYDKYLGDIVKIQKLRKGEKHGRYVYPIIAEKRNALKNYLFNNGIETKIFHEPLASEAPVHKKFNMNDTPLAKKILRKNLIIPSHENLSLQQVSYVANHIRKFYEKHKFI